MDLAEVGPRLWRNDGRPWTKPIGAADRAHDPLPLLSAPTATASRLPRFTEA